MLFRSLIPAAALVAPTLAYAQDLEGPAYVIDGDTVVVNRTHIRLHGIEAKAEHRGIWAGSFEEPSQWRRDHRVTGYIGHEHHSSGYVHVPYFYWGR
jgi:endonuclease YncB( thermonuclease family)